MKALIVYDSMYGNTEQIAKAIVEGLGKSAESRIVKAADAKPEDVSGINLLIIGSPTQGAKMTVPVQDFLNKLSSDNLKNVKTAAFDTRMTNKIIGLFGFAAPKIAKSLEEKGTGTVVPAEGFWVKGGKGPLKENEIARASKWGESLSTSAAK